MLHHNFHAWEPWAGVIRTRNSGSLVADRPGPATAYAIVKLEDRGSLFIKPGDQVYEGRVVGEHFRAEDLDVNIVREKHLTNMRSSTGDVLVRLNAARDMSLDEAIEFIRDDECVEVTPDQIRLRKLHLTMAERARERSRLAAARAAAEARA
jgi:GTP-binding protein